MKNEQDIQRAHDLLAGIVLGEVPMVLRPEVKVGIHTALDTLCWILEHDHNQAFSKNLVEIERSASRLGYELKREGPTSQKCGYDEIGGRDVQI